MELTSHEPYTQHAAYPGGVLPHEAHASGVSWPAVIAGAFAAAALSLILLALGAGLGLSSVSPFANTGATASAIGTATILWLIVMEVLSSAMGGYIAGRLRTKWTSIHTDEVYFRDTAHGFLAWATALVVTAAFLGSAATAMIGSSVSQGKTESSISSQAVDPNAYFVDEMFRSNIATTDSISGTGHPEAAIIFANALRQGSLSATDKAYLSQLVSAKTGMPTANSDQRVTAAFADAQQAAEATRKAVAHTLLWTFVALLIGAFCASLSATFGGRQRDQVVTV
jgi:hypothetical protein